MRLSIGLVIPFEIDASYRHWPEHGCFPDCAPGWMTVELEFTWLTDLNRAQDPLNHRYDPASLAKRETDQLVLSVRILQPRRAPEPKTSLIANALASCFIP